MNKNFLLCLISIALVMSCTNLPNTPAVATAPVATPTPENYSLYTNSELQIYSETIDLKIQEALKNNNPNQAQELGRKRQELIAEFNRRGLTRKPVEPLNLLAILIRVLGNILALPELRYPAYPAKTSST